jgi:group I intron endonuclease
MKIGIYKITNTKNGKFYVGSSKNIDVRFKSHVSALVAKRHHCKHLQFSFDKHGLESFSFDVIEICESAEAALKREGEILKEVHGTKNCFNSSPLAIGHLVSDHVRKLTVEGMLKSEFYKKSHSEVCKKRNADPAFRERLKAGIKNSEKHREAVKKNASTHLQTEESKRKAFETRMKNGKQKIAAFKVATEVLQRPEIRQKSLLATSRAVKGVNVKTGDVLFFESQSAAARFFGKKHATGISTCCRNQNLSCHGYKWEYDLHQSTSLFKCSQALDKMFRKEKV